MLHLIPLSPFFFERSFCWKTQDIFLNRRESFFNLAITMQYGSPCPDLPMNTKGQMRDSSKGSALVATS